MIIVAAYCTYISGGFCTAVYTVSGCSLRSQITLKLIRVPFLYHFQGSHLSNRIAHTQLVVAQTRPAASGAH